jgi:hypothetical protein
MKNLYTIISVILLAAILVPNTSAQNQESLSGFREAEWDMSREEVSSAIKAELSRVKGSRQPYKMSLFRPFRIESDEIGSFTYNVDFYFAIDDTTLGMVEVQPTDDSPSIVHFRELSELLTKKYGEPDTQEDQDNPGGGKAKVKRWILGSTFIEIDYTKYAPNLGGGVSIKLRYEKKESEGTEKL